LWQADVKYRVFRVTYSHVMKYRVFRVTYSHVIKYRVFRVTYSHIIKYRVFRVTYRHVMKYRVFRMTYSHICVALQSEYPTSSDERVTARILYYLACQGPYIFSAVCLSY
jgi:hypothetical protein